MKWMEINDRKRVKRRIKTFSVFTMISIYIYNKNWFQINIQINKSIDLLYSYHRLLSEYSLGTTVPLMTEHLVSGQKPSL